MSKLARMHTAEHILSAVMRKFYGAPRNLELHLGEKKTKCDYKVSHILTDKDIQQIESRVNQEIQKNYLVTHFFVPRAKAQKFDLWKVPEEVEEIRIVKIGDFDEQPCKGPHVNHTLEVGTFKIISYEHRANGRLRIRFKVL